MSEKRNKRMSIYFTESEINTMASNFNIELPIEGQFKLKRMAGTVRKIALNKKVLVRTVSPIAVDQFRELSRLSSNLNQLSHHVNRGDDIDFNELSRLTSELRIKLLNIK